MTEFTEIQYIKGIGPKRAQVLQKSGLATVIDLMNYFPRRYLDRRNIVSLDNLQADEEVTVIGRIEAAGIRHARKKIFYIVINDEKSILEAVWFNYAEYYKNVFKVGEWVSLSGKVNYYRGFQMTHPDYDKLGDGDYSNLLNTGKIIPVYPGNESLKRAYITSNTFRKILADVAQKYFSGIKDFLPRSILNRHNFPERKICYQNIHFPESGELLDAAIRRFKYEELFFLELMLAMQNFHIREEEAGIAFEKPSPNLEALFNRLPFEMTAAQKKVVKEIRADMKRPHPMNRLLQGDVGSGKTLVALMAMLITVDNGYQAALMVPTEILAEQHYFNISNALQETNIRISLLTGSTSEKDRHEIYKLLQQKEPHIIIGTHALIQEKVDFSRLGLAVVDEQHRFGVMQRASLQEKGIQADVLVMTATPIPRTLALTVYGNLDVSIIDEMPPNRQMIHTVWRFDDKAKDIYRFILERIAKGEQAFIIFPLVEESEKLDLKAASESFEKFKMGDFAGIKMALLHGRMKAQEKEQIMRGFAGGEIKILVSTTVVEVGVDIPNATVMLIEHAERFGLAQLHQLRGRVGRSNLKSYCILKTPLNIGDTAKQRLKIMTETNDGFKIAEEDLKIRGWGDFFGVKQSGMPTFKLANPVLDQELLKEARKDAIELISRDPQLRNEDVRLLREKFMEDYKDRLHLVKIS